MDKLSRKLQQIKDRYFRPVIKYPEGHLTHHGDCYTYRAIDIYNTAPCTCGLIHDLRPLPCSVIKKLYAKFLDDDMKAESGRFIIATADLDPAKIIANIFGNNKEYLIDQDDFDYEWEVIGEVFGEDFKNRRRKECAESADL